MSDSTITPRVPGRFWYIVALILFIASMTAPVTITLWQVFGREDVTLRLVAPQTLKVRLDRGTYTVFSDSRAVINGEVVISQGSIAGLRFSVRGPRGDDIPVGPTTLASRYSYGGQTGFSVLEFKIPEGGEYTIAAAYREADPRQRALLSIRRDFFGGLLGSIFTAVAISVGGSLLAVFIFLRTLYARRKLILQSFTSGFAQGRGTVYTPPGTGKPQTGKPQKPEPPASPVEHQYDRDK